jgi:hypothetical protein
VKPRKIGGEDRWRRRPQAPITFAQDLFNCACGFFCLAQSGERPERWVLPAWADRYPLIAEATGGLQVRRWRRRAGVERLRYRRADHSVFLFAFDLLEINGQDLRREPPEVQKARKRGPSDHQLTAMRVVGHFPRDRVPDSTDVQAQIEISGCGA